jgi:predicted NAD/FAD-binding protein
MLRRYRISPYQLLVSNMYENRQSVAVIGSGAAGLAASWLLRHKCDVCLFEKDDRLGGHAHTAQLSQEGGGPDIDTGFIVYNEPNYPNLTQWLNVLGIETISTDMSFSVSQENGGFEYKGGNLAGLFAQPANLTKPRFWSMLRSLVRFYKTASASPLPDSSVSLRDYLASGDYSTAFVNDHLLPFGAAIWSTSQQDILDYPAASFIRFCQNHGLLKLSDRPQWRTIKGGSHRYVEQVRNALGDDACMTSAHIVSVIRAGGKIIIEDRSGETQQFDHIVFATHADQALSLLHDADYHENRLLSPFRYEKNLAILHTDQRLLPKRRAAWASWNAIDYGVGDQSKPSVSYWMNNLQSLSAQEQYIVSLNPAVSPRAEKILRTQVYEHPIFNGDTLLSQRQLWSLQGRRNTWFCGAYFGAGFHEDAIQSGLAVAEQLSGVSRPWTVDNPSSRIVIDSAPLDEPISISA